MTLNFSYNVKSMCCAVTIAKMSALFLRNKFPIEKCMVGGRGGREWLLVYICVVDVGLCNRKSVVLSSAV